MKQLKLKIALSTLLLTLGGCQTTPDQPAEMKEGLAQAISETNVLNSPKPLTQVPNSVQQELMQQDMAQAKQGLLSEKRLEVSATSVAAKDFFTAIVAGSAYSIAIHPEVSGSISLSLTDVTLTEVLTVVEDIYGFDIRRSGNVIQVYPAGIRTETIALNYLFLKRFGTSSTTINSGGVSENDPNSNSNNSNSNNSSNNGSSNNQNSQNNQNGQKSNSGINIYTENESDFWTELKETLTAFVGTTDGRSVIISPQAGLVTVRGLPSEITAVKKFINDTETHLHRQVIIEAKIMEVTLNDEYQQGIHWNEVLGSLGSTDLTFSTSGKIAGNAISGKVGGATSLSFSGTDFSGVIDLLQTQGNVQVLSSPRITATNNQKAVIKVGEDEYFVTDVSSTTTTGTSTTTTPEVELTPFFSGIALDVTPQIDKDGNVILHVHPSVTLTAEQNKVIQLGGQELILPLAQSRVRESDTIIRAKSGEIVVIGGLIETYKTDQESKTPLLGDIPLLGGLFKSVSEVTQKRELVILLKPIVIGQDTWKTQLQDARSLLQKWFPEEDEPLDAQ
ncbi:MAG: pilus (MSHA type) biogenesis protein MshL [Colwellia sp.]|nr:pilus (MSHA type) biogenesis protein MshL [Colwellia sp.]